MLSGTTEDTTVQEGLEPEQNESELEAESTSTGENTQVDAELEKSEESKPKDGEPEDDDTPSGEEPEDETNIVTIGDTPQDEPLENDSSVIREMRKSNRKLVKQNREYQRQIDATRAAEAKPVELGKKPTLEDEDIDHDVDIYQEKMSKWYENKAEVAEKEVVQKREWQVRKNAYDEAKTKLNINNFEEAEETIKEVLSIDQQNIILAGSSNAALVVAALGNNPKKLRELSQIKDSTKFAFAVAKTEVQMKVTTKKRPVTNPEGKLQGSGGHSSDDRTLQRLEAEADKTGDRTKIAAHNRKMRSLK